MGKRSWLKFWHLYVHEPVQFKPFLGGKNRMSIQVPKRNSRKWHRGWWEWHVALVSISKVLVFKLFDFQFHWSSFFRFSDEQFTVKAGFLQHRVPCFGFVVEEKPLPGRSVSWSSWISQFIACCSQCSRSGIIFRLDAKKLKEFGIKPGPDYKRIKDGETLTNADGMEVDILKASLF